MSMRPRVLAEVPEQTAAVARAAFRKPTLAMRVRDELGEVFAGGGFIDAFGIRGRPGISPGQLAMVTVLQFAENLTDRQAAAAGRGRIDWKILSRPGIDRSGLPRSSGGTGAGHRAGPSAHRRDPCRGRGPRS